MVGKSDVSHSSAGGEPIFGKGMAQAVPHFDEAECGACDCREEYRPRPFDIAFPIPTARRELFLRKAAMRFLYSGVGEHRRGRSVSACLLLWTRPAGEMLTAMAMNSSMCITSAP